MFETNNKYRKFLQAMSLSVQSNAPETHIKRPTERRDGDDNIKPITPYNFKTTIITDWIQKEDYENNNAKSHMW